MSSPTCFRCARVPAHIGEYIDAAEGLEMTPDEYVRRHEGTYNPATDHFACTSCYLAIGAPTSPDGWKAP